MIGDILIQKYPPAYTTCSLAEGARSCPGDDEKKLPPVACFPIAPITGREEGE